jgi:hypothetical protein
MVKDLDRPKEPASKRATRMWRNHALTKKIKEGKKLVPLFVDPDCIDYENNKVHLPKEAPPQPAEVIENEARPRVNRFESKFIKDIRAMMNEHKAINVAWYRAVIYQQKRRLLLEKLRRLEASITARQGERS